MLRRYYRRTPTARSCIELCARQHPLGPQAAERRGAELELAAIERGELDHDREAEPGTRLGLVQPPAAAGDLLALRGRKPGTVIVDRDADHPRAAGPVEL